MMRVIDMHCDTIAEGLLQSGGTKRLKRNDLHVDVGKLVCGGALAQFFALFIPSGADAAVAGKPVSAWEYFEAAHACYTAELAANADRLAPAFNAADILKNRRNGRISALLTVEDGALLEGDLSRLDLLYEKGVRLITLTWNNENCLGYPNFTGDPSAMDAPLMARGLKPFGIEAVARMNELGMIVDVSHLSDGGFFDVARVSKKPFVASHSNSRALCNVPRNLTDDMLRVIGDTGGAVGVTFVGYFLTGRDDDTVQIERILAHALHIRRKAGIGALAFGSDFDGFSGRMEFLDYSGYPALIRAFEKRFTPREMEKILYKNVLRVLRDVTGG